MASRAQIRIYQANLGRGRNATSELLNVALQEKAQVLLIQEPYTHENRVSGFQSHSNTVIACNKEDEKPWACVVILDDTLTATVLRHVSTSHCVCVNISGPTENLYVVSLYCQLSHDIQRYTQQLETALEVTGNRRTVIGCDANATSPLWDFTEEQGTDSETRRQSRQKGQVLEDLMAARGLLALNVPGQLSTSVRGIRSIDVTLVTEDMSAKFGEWKVRDGWTSSDHRVITYLYGDTKINQEQQMPRYSVKKARWNDFRRKMRVNAENLKQLPLENEENIDAYVEALTAAIHRAAKGTIPFKKRFVKSVPWWNGQLTEQKRKVHRLRREHQQERDPVEKAQKKAAYRAERRQYTEKTSETRNKSWKDYVTRQSEEDTYGFIYKQSCEKVAPKTAMTAIRTPEGHTSDWSETAEAILDGWFGTGQEEERVPQMAEDGSYEPWTEQEIQMAIKKAKNGKAPGMDRIETEMIKEMTKEHVVLRELARLYNSCQKQGIFPKAWKEGSVVVLLKSKEKDPTEVKSYRPVCLLPILSKILERLIQMRIKDVILRPGFASRQQYGYREGRGTEQAIEEMCRLADEKDEDIVMGIFFDITGAFDHLRWRDVLNELERRQCSAAMHGMVRDYLHERKMTIIINYGKKTKVLIMGCPQGSIVGPDCWNICLDELLEELEREGISAVAYADDIGIVVGGNSRRELETRMQVATDFVYGWSVRHGLQLSESKTEMMLLKDKSSVAKGRKKKAKQRQGSLAKSLLNPGQGGVRPPVVKIRDKSIKYSMKVRYLGVTLEPLLRIKSHIDVVGGKANKMVENLGKVSRRDWGLSCRFMQTIYVTVYLPIVLYAVGAWGALPHDARKLDRLHRYTLIRISKGYRTVSTEALQVLTGNMPLSLEAKERYYKYKIRMKQAFTCGTMQYRPEDDVAEAKEELHRQVIMEWQLRWQETDKGAVTKKFFPSVQERMENKNVQLDHYTAQFMTGHGDFRAKLRSFALSDTDLCDCGQIDTSDHELFHCQLYEEERQLLKEKVEGDQRPWPIASAELVKCKELFELFRETCCRISRRKEESRR